MQFQMPDLGEGIYEAELVEWLVSPGQTVAPGESLVEVMTDKATLEIPSPFSGVIQELQAKAGDQIQVGQVILSYETSGGDKAPAGSEATSEAANQPAAGDREGNGRERRTGEAATPPPAASGVQAAPSVRRMARQLGVDLESVRGSGPGGRILIEDLTPAVQRADDPAGSQVERTATTAKPQHRPGERLALRGIRRITAERTREAKQIIPHFSYVDQCNVSRLSELRSSLKQHFLEQHKLKLTYLPFLVKAVAEALRQVPMMNASLDEEAEEVVLHEKCHLGIATDTRRGLLAPVLHDADRLSFVDVAAELDRLTSAARAGTIRREDLQGGTFTITSIGSLGGLISTPIIRHPEAGILGIGKIDRRPIYNERGELQAADMLYLSLSLDHRLLDGADAAAFTNAVIRRLENPAPLLLP